MPPPHHRCDHHSSMLSSPRGRCRWCRRGHASEESPQPRWSGCRCCRCSGCVRVLVDIVAGAYGSSSRGHAGVFIAAAVRELLSESSRLRRTHCCGHAGDIAVVIPAAVRELLSVLSRTQGASSSWLRGNPHQLRHGRVGLLVVAAAAWGSSRPRRGLRRCSCAGFVVAAT